MIGYYLLTLAGLLVAAFFVGRSRAIAAAGQAGRLHSLPAYHGLLPMAVVLLLMLLTLVIGTSLAARFAENGALAYLGDEAIRDPLRRAAGLREIINVSTGAYSGTPSPAVQEASDYYVAASRNSNIVVFAVGVALALASIFLITGRVSTTFHTAETINRSLDVVRRWV